MIYQRKTETVEVLQHTTGVLGAQIQSLVDDGEKLADLQAIASDGDYVVKDAAGNVYLARADNFEALYEEATP